MASLQLDLLALSDEQALSALISAIGAFSESARFQLLVLDGSNATDSEIAQARQDPIVSKVLAEKGSLFRNASAVSNISGSSCTIRFTREPSGACTAHLDISGNASNDAALRTRVLIAFRKAFEPFVRYNMVSQFAPELAEFYTKRDSTLLRLEDIATRAAENTEAYRRTLDVEAGKRKEQLGKDYEAQVEQLRAEYASKEASLEHLRLALEEREKDLEKADNTHARRKIRQDLKTILKERHSKFALTDDTVLKRRPITAAFLFLMTVTLGAALFFGWLAARDLPQGMPPWLPSLRLALSIAGFAGACIYYIRWQDRWSEIHAEEEFGLKRLDLDIDRASWLVEVLLEWRGDGSVPAAVPNELIDKLAGGLFETRQGRPAAKHPVEDVLAALLSSPTSLKVNMPGGELNLDRRSINKAKET